MFIRNIGKNKIKGDESRLLFCVFNGHVRKLPAKKREAFSYKKEKNLFFHLIIYIFKYGSGKQSAYGASHDGALYADSAHESIILTDSIRRLLADFGNPVLLCLACADAL